MPVVILLDTSLSMKQNVSCGDNTTFSRLDLAIRGINHFIDCQRSHNRLDLTSLLLFSGTCSVAKGFTRDHEAIKSLLPNICPSGKANIIHALDFVRSFVTDEWGSNFQYQVLLITDGNAVLQASYLNKKLSFLNSDNDSKLDSTESANWLLPLPFKAKIHIICMTTQIDSSFQHSLPFFKEILLKNSSTQKQTDIIVNHPCDGGQIWVPNVPLLSYSIVEELFMNLNSEHFKPLKGKLKCGNLTCPVMLYPNLPPDLAKNHNFVDIDICGFLSNEELASPGACSKHLVLPTAETLEEFKKWTTFLNFRSDMTDEELISLFGDEGRQPSFGVLLHGSFKVAGMAALCQLCPPSKWYGILYSGMDNKKKSCLMLSTLEPGVDGIPWIAKFDNLGIAKSDEINPIKAVSKPKYNTWLSQSGIQTDVQKLLRYARKLPEKHDSLLAEASRIKKIAFQFQFFDALEGIIMLLDREASLMAANSHPDSANMLSNTIKFLKSPDILDIIKYN